MKGLEPPRLTTPDPKSGAATNYATSAIRCKARQKYKIFYFKYRNNAALYIFLPNHLNQQKKILIYSKFYPVLTCIRAEHSLVRNFYFVMILCFLCFSSFVFLYFLTLRLKV